MGVAALGKHAEIGNIRETERLNRFAARDVQEQWTVVVFSQQTLQLGLYFLVVLQSLVQQASPALGQWPNGLLELVVSDRLVEAFVELHVQARDKRAHLRQRYAAFLAYTRRDAILSRRRSIRLAMLGQELFIRQAHDDLNEAHQLATVRVCLQALDELAHRAAVHMTELESRTAQVHSLPHHVNVIAWHHRLRLGDLLFGGEVSEQVVLEADRRVNRLVHLDALLVLDQRCQDIEQLDHDRVHVAAIRDHVTEGEYEGVRGARRSSHHFESPKWALEDVDGRLKVARDKLGPSLSVVGRDKLDVCELERIMSHGHEKARVRVQKRGAGLRVYGELSLDCGAQESVPFDQERACLVEEWERELALAQCHLHGYTLATQSMECVSCVLRNNKTKRNVKYK